jgi:hypothetical protein
MNRKIILLILVVAAGGWLAFRFYWQQPRPKRPDEFTKTDIESEVREGLKLKEVRLTETAKGEFFGTGSASDGTNYKIRAVQGPNKITWESEDDKGGKVIGSKGWGGGQTR